MKTWGPWNFMNEMCSTSIFPKQNLPKRLGWIDSYTEFERSMLWRFPCCCWPFVQAFLVQICIDPVQFWCEIAEMEGKSCWEYSCWWMRKPKGNQESRHAMYKTFNTTILFKIQVCSLDADFVCVKFAKGLLCCVKLYLVECTDDEHG